MTPNPGTEQVTTEELLKRFIDAVEKLAFEIPAPNVYTQRLLQLCIDASPTESAPGVEGRWEPQRWVMMPTEPTNHMQRAIVEAYWTNRNLDMVYHAAVAKRPAVTPPTDALVVKAMARVVEAYDAYDRSWDDTTKTNADVCKLEAELDKAVANWRALTPKRTP